MRLRGEKGEWDENPCYDGCPAQIGFVLRLLQEAILCLLFGHKFRLPEQRGEDDPAASEWNDDWIANTRHCMRCDRMWHRAGWEEFKNEE